MKQQDFLKRLQHDDIVAAIRAAEQKTSGEIRVFISRKDDVVDVVARAQARFEKMGMTRTQQRNGVLIYVAPGVRKFAVIGDTGVHEKCGGGFWTALAAEMTGHFKNGEFTVGIIHGIRKTGELLAVHFPRQAGDANELSDAVEQD